MKKILKIILITLLVIILIDLIALIVDSKRIRKNKEPIFILKKEQYRDGGTKEFYGLGYKIIKYNKLNGYNKMHVGSWFLKYDTNLGRK